MCSKYYIQWLCIGKAMRFVNSNDCKVINFEVMSYSVYRLESPNMHIFHELQGEMGHKCRYEVALTRLVMGCSGTVRAVSVFSYPFL